MKKWIAIVSVTAMVLCLLPAAALAAEGDIHAEGLWVGQERADGTVEIVAYTGGVIGGGMTIPPAIAGYAVAGIDSGVASGTKSVQSSSGQKYEWGWLVCGTVLAVTGVAGVLIRRRAEKDR